MRFLQISSLFALAAVARAGPISLVRSSLVPVSPPACVGKPSNFSVKANSASNPTVTFNSTSIISPSDLPDLSNATVVSNTTDLGNSATTISNSTDSSTAAVSDSTDAGDATSTDSGDVTSTDSGDATATDSGDATSTDAGSATSTDAGDAAATAADSAATITAAAAPSPTDVTPDVPPLTELPLGGTEGRRSFLPRWLRMRVPKLRRIAQADLPDVAQSWQDLCLASGGDIFTNEPCVQLAGVNGINALLASGDACAQQDNADAMIDFAKSAGVTNGAALIANAIAYRQHPRNALNIGGVLPSTPYCQKAPRNPELNGIVNAQLDGVDPGLFGGPDAPVVAFGDDSTCPFGQTPDPSTCTCN